METKWKKGTELTTSDREYVLRSYVHRWTADHRPNWSQDTTATPVQFASDGDWLENTLFRVKSDGSLDMRARYCMSTPSWPKEAV